MRQVYRLSQLATTKNRPGLLPVSPATIWRWTAQGRFPKPFRLGSNTTVWDAAEVANFVAQQRGGAT